MCSSDLFGQRIEPGQLIHADKHGFLAVPKEDEAKLLEAARFMDANECNTVIPAARGAAGKPFAQVLAEMDAAGAAFRDAAKKKFSGEGEW